MLKLPLVAPKFRLRRVQKNGKKEQKTKNRILQKTLFYFCMFTSWILFWGSIRIGKTVWGRCARQKVFLTFCRQLRCEILEISSYIDFRILSAFQVPIVLLSTSLSASTQAIIIIFQIYRVERHTQGTDASRIHIIYKKFSTLRTSSSLSFATCNSPCCLNICYIYVFIIQQFIIQLLSKSKVIALNLKSHHGRSSVSITSNKVCVNIQSCNPQQPQDVKTKIKYLWSNPCNACAQTKHKREKRGLIAFILVGELYAAAYTLCWY